MNLRLFLVSFLFLFLINSVVAEDIAYVVKNPTAPDNVLINAINELSSEIGYTLTYKLIDDSAVATTDFSKYRVILIGDEIINNVPVNSYKSMIVNPDYYDFCSSDVGSVSSSQPLAIYNGWGNEITNGLPVKTNGYTSGGSIPVYYLNRLSSGCNKVSSLYNDLTDYVVVSKDNPRRVFFGITRTSYWTTESKQLFKNSLKWILQGDDMDGDGYFAGDDCNDNDANKWQLLPGYIDSDRDGFGAGSSINVCSGDYLPIGYSDNNLDCNDNNFNVNPEATELPYNGVDDDCNGYDLADFDVDGYCKLGYAIINKNLQCPSETGTVGTDCRDNDASYNPGSSDINKNCVNKAPVVEPISKITVNEGEVVRITVRATDYENDTLTYSINDSQRFLKSANVFTWETGYQDSGNYMFKISVSDGKSTTYTNVEIEVVDRNQPPVFGEVNCTNTILEDAEYQCDIIATDFENNDFNFTITNENKLNCSMHNNVLTYKSYKDYFGTASCIIRASDAYGHRDYPFTVNIQNVNDAPIIIGYVPLTSNPRILNNTNQAFSVTIKNVDNDNINIDWFFNNQKVGSGANYTFNANKGSYNLTVTASDGEYPVSHYWDVFVGSAEELTCSEAKGFVCSSSEVCNGYLLGVLDSKSCCNIACSEKPPAFKDIAKKCQNRSNNLEITFKDITSMDTFTIGEIATKKLEIKNNANISQEVVLEIYLYDLTKEKILKKERYSFSMDSKTYKFQNFDISIPWSVNEKNKLAVFVNVKGDGKTNYCNSDYVKIAPERTFDRIIIENTKVDKTDISCGDSFDLYTKLRNIGTDEHNVVLKFDNSVLKIKQTIEDINLEGYGGHDSSENTLTLTVPEGTKAGNYTIRIVAYSDSNIMASSDFKINLGECKKEVSSSTGLGIIKLANANNFQIFEDPKNRNIIIWNSVIVSLVLGLLLVTVVYKGIKRNKTKKELEREISKIIKRKNGRHKTKKQVKNKRKR